MESTPDYGALLRRSDTPREPMMRVRDDVGRQGVTVGLRTQDGQLWPTTSSPDLLCWYCCHAFTTPPVPLPTAYCKEQDMFLTTGMFCSWGCMKAYNFERKHYRKDANAIIIAQFAARCCGHPVPIRSAPPRCQLRAFGGDLSIVEFRAASGELPPQSSGASRPLPAILPLNEAAMREPAALKQQPDPLAAAARRSSKEAAAASGSKEPADPCSASLKLKRNQATPPVQFDLLSKAMGLQFGG